jgi:hypothetical protein
MITHASPQFTPAQLIDAGRRAEAEGRPDLAVKFYRHLTEHFAGAAETAEAHGALGRIGVWQTDPGNGAPAAARGILRRPPPSGRDHYIGGRALARLLGLLGWLVVLGGPAGVPGYLILRAEPAALSRAEVLPIACGAAGSLILGIGVVLAARTARALFDQANAARDLVALERARQGFRD